MKKTLIISEIGVNHSGSMATAYKQIELSKGAGCDIAKFQYYEAEKLLGKKHPAFAYAKSCHLTKPELESLKTYCDTIGIEFLVSVFDIQDLAWAITLCKRIKVATRMNNNRAFLAECRKLGKPLLISTEAPYSTCKDDEIYMYCVPKYPTELKDINLPFLATCEGFSTHCPDISPALYAVSRNCKVVEAHTTISRDQEGCDQSSSWTYEEMKQFVSIIRKWESLQA